MKVSGKSLTRKVFIVGVVLLFSGCGTYGINAQVTEEEESLLQITKQFQNSLTEKDSMLFKSLFLHDSIPWVGISGAKSWAYSKVRNPNIKQINEGSCIGFIRYVVSNPGRIEEKLFNISTDVDEVLATLSFDYSFWKDQHPFNWGRESWMLVKANGKWKIAAVYYSGFGQSVEPMPPHLL